MERLGPKVKEPVQVQLGEAFSVSPSLDKIRKDWSEFLELDVIPFEVEYSPGETRTGVITFSRDHEGPDRISRMAKESNIEFPAGEIKPQRAELILDEGRRVTTEVFIHVMFTIELKGLQSIEEWETTSFELTIDGKRYFGHPDRSDAWAWVGEHGDNPDLFVNNWWSTANNPNPRHLYFPHDPDVFRRMRLVINKA